MFFSYNIFFQLQQLFPIITIFSVIAIFFNYNFFQLSQFFSIITIFFNYNNFFNYHIFFQLWQFLSIITIFFNCHSLFDHSLFYHKLFQSLYNLWYYFHENKPTYKFHHLKRIFYCQSITKIFCQLHKFLIYAFYYKFFSFCV